MNILLTIGTPDMSGGPKMACLYTRELLRRGHRVVVVCGAGEQGHAIVKSLADAGASVFCETGFEKLFGRKLISRMASIINAQRIDCVISGQQIDLKIAALAARKSGVCCIAFLQGPARFFGSWLTRSIKSVAYRIVLNRYVSHVICVSEGVRRQHVEQFGFDKRHANLLENGVDIGGMNVASADEAAACRAELGAGPGDVLMLNVGRLDPLKGQDVLIRAFAAADFGQRRTKLAIVGDVTSSTDRAGIVYLDRLRQLVTDHKLSDRVKFVGWRNDIPQLLAASDMYVHSSYWEGLPLAMLEAMAAGKPVISTDCSDDPSGFMRGIHGQVVRRGDVAAMTSALEQMVELSDEQRQQMGRAGHRLAEEYFDINVTRQRFAELVEKIGSSTPLMQCSPHPVGAF